MQSAKPLSDYYDKGVYPFELIYRMLTCNKEGQSAEARLLGAQFHGTTPYVMKDFKRATPEIFKHTLLSYPWSKRPESIHMALFRDGDHQLVRARKELVFDMDITDFYRFCPCRSFKNLCPSCWSQIQGASLILDHLLQEVLAYEKEHCMWVFSGRKGVHCFVNHPLAMGMSDTDRKQLHKRLTIAVGDDAHMAAFITSLSREHPEFVTKLERFFCDRVLKECDLFNLPVFETHQGQEDSFELFCLRYLRVKHPALYELVKDAWQRITLSPSSSTKKARLDSDGHSGGGDNISTRKWKILQELETLSRNGLVYKPSVFLMVRFMYPVIDPAPLKLNHQLKLPFSVHSFTRCIAFPLRQESIMRMDVSKDTFTVDQLCGVKKLPVAFTEGIEVLEEWIERY